MPYFFSQHHEPRYTGDQACAGIWEVNFHSLRHTHATELSEAGVKLKETQRRLGHKTLKVTPRVYLHATDAMENQAVEIMNRMYENRGEHEKGLSVDHVGVVTGRPFCS